MAADTVEEDTEAATTTGMVRIRTIITRIVAAPETVIQATATAAVRATATVVAAATVNTFRHRAPETTTTITRRRRRVRPIRLFARAVLRIRRLTGIAAALPIRTRSSLDTRARSTRARKACGCPAINV